MGVFNRYYIQDTTNGKKVRVGGGKIQPQQTYFKSRDACEIECRQKNNTVGFRSGNPERFRVMLEIALQR